jgi:hypothetical protein
MKIYLNEFEVLELNETQLAVIANDIPTLQLEDDLKRRLSYIVTSKYDACFDRLFKEWFPKLAARGVASIPTDKEAFAQLVFSQPDYKDRSTRDAEALAAQQGE